MSDVHGPSAKFTAIDAANSNGKAAVLAADSFAMSQNSLAGTVESLSQNFEQMQESHHRLEQQVKAMARIMEGQNVAKLGENLKMAQDDLHRTLLYQMNEKHKELASSVEREVAAVSDTKIGILKKIDAVEAQIMAAVGSKLDEASHARRANKEKIERLEDFMETVPNISDKTNGMIKQLEGKLSDLKSEFRVFVADQSQNDRAQDKQTSLLTSEVRTALEAAKDKIAEETKSLSRMIQKRENVLHDGVKEVRDMIEKESGERGDTIKSIQRLVKDEVEKVKVHADKRLLAAESSQDHKVRPCMAALKELKRCIEEEACHRDTADKDLARRIAQEIQERHSDEERLVSLISTCQDAVAKLRRS